jgi:hypothetical protein
MRTRRAEFAVLLVTIGLSFIIHLPPSLAHTRPSVSKKAKAVPAPPSPPYWDMEVAALRQQSEEQRQLLDTLRGQFEERRLAAEALAARVEERRAAESVLTAQLEQLREEGQRLRSLLYGAIGAIIVLGLLIRLQDLSLYDRTRTRRLTSVRDDESAMP